MPTAPGVSGVVALGVADVVVGAEGDVVVGGVVVGGAVVLGGAVEDGGVVLLGGAAVGAPVADVGAPVMPDEPVEPAPPIVGLARTNDGAAAVAPDAPDWTQPVTVTIWVEPDVAERVVGD